MVAKVTLAKAKTVEELRQAQAVVLPLEFGLSLEQTAQAIGVSVGWACQLRTRFVRMGGAPGDSRAMRGGARRRENMTRDEEAAFLAPFFEKAKIGGILIVGEIKQALDVRLGVQSGVGVCLQPVASSWLAQACARQATSQSGRRRARGVEKNSPTSSRKSPVKGKAKGPSG